MNTIRKHPALSAWLISPWVLVAMLTMVIAAPQVMGNNTDGDAQPLQVDVNPPEAFQARRVSNGMKLTWELPETMTDTQGCASYNRAFQFRWKETGQADTEYWMDAATGGNTATEVTYLDSQTQGKFEAGKRYKFQMRARLGNPDDIDDHHYSEWVSAQAMWPSTADVVPARMDAPELTVSGRQVTIRWDEPTDMSVKSFTIKRRETNSPSREREFTVSNMGRAATEFVDTSANRNKDYGYFIAAVNNKGAGSESPGDYIDR